MTSKTFKSPPQPVRLTDSEELFCKATGIDINNRDGRLLLSEVKVRVATRATEMSATSANEATRQHAFKAGVDLAQID
jgi:hypothetical protein